MRKATRNFVFRFATLLIAGSLQFAAFGQYGPGVRGETDGFTILTAAELTRVVPPGFYFQGLSAPTQMRNSAAARFGSKRYVIAGMVDTSGYAADVRAKYEGFFIVDSPVM